MYTRSRGGNQTPQNQNQNTSFVRGPTLNAGNNYQSGNSNFSQANTPQKQAAQAPGTPVAQKIPTAAQQQQTLAKNPGQAQTPQKPFSTQANPVAKPTALFNQTPEKKDPIGTPAQNNSQVSIPGLGAQGQDNPMDYEDVMPEGDGFSEGGEQPAQTGPRWKRNKVQGTKVNRKLRRLRMNQRLRKTLMPKNAIMVLNEMKAGVQFTFPESQSVSSSLFLVHAELDGKTYVGQGLSKPLARQNAAENALKSLLLEKMTAAANKARSDAENDPQGGGDGANASDDTVATPVVGATENNADGTPAAMNVDDGDEIPWSSLASFALYKLFLEWQNQGTVVPIPRPGNQPAPRAKTSEAKPAVAKTLPENALSVHPVMLLNQMKPGITYVEVSRSGNPPNTLFTLSVEIDGKSYTGAAKNKRDAKKTAAKTALRALFNLEYPEEPKSEEPEAMQTEPLAEKF